MKLEKMKRCARKANHIPPLELDSRIGVTDNRGFKKFSFGQLQVSGMRRKQM
jgi:hypothetical protein